MQAINDNYIECRVIAHDSPIGDDTTQFGFDYNNLIRVTRACDERGSRRWAVVTVRCANGDEFDIFSSPLKTYIESRSKSGHKELLYEKRGKR